MSETIELKDNTPTVTVGRFLDWMPKPQPGGGRKKSEPQTWYGADSKLGLLLCWVSPSEDADGFALLEWIKNDPLLISEDNSDIVGFVDIGIFSSVAKAKDCAVKLNAAISQSCLEAQQAEFDRWTVDVEGFDEEYDQLLDRADQGNCSQQIQPSRWDRFRRFITGEKE